MAPSAAGLARPARHVLDNGLTAIVHAVSHAPVATFWVWYRVGSRNERSGHSGISHWVEHMLFKGTERFAAGELDRRIAREGGVFNGMTWLDWTTYFETLPADRIQLALDIESDRMTGALFDAADVESERTVVIAEREGHENSPLFLLSEEVQSTVFKLHPYRNEVIGWKSDLHTIQRGDLIDHYRHFYHPANAVAVAVGAFDPDDMLTRIEAAFGGLAPGTSPPLEAMTEPEQRGERRVEVLGEDQTRYVMLATRAPAASHADAFAFQVLDSVLGGAKSMNLFGGSPPNRSSRLYRALVETGLATAVNTGMAATVDPYLYTVTAVVREGADPQTVESVIAAELDRVLVEELTAAEVARAAKQARAQFAYSAESVTNMGFWYGFAEVIADQDWLAQSLERLTAVTPGDVLEAAQRWLARPVRTIGHYRPGGAE